MSVPASAADVARGVPPAAVEAAAPSSPWTFSVSLYGWTAGVDARARTLPPLPAVDINLSITDVLENLDIAVMGLIEARNGPWMLMADLVYSRISPGRSFSVAGLNGTVGLDSRAFIGLGAIGYRLWDNGRLSFDGFVGARVWSLDNTLTLTVPGVGSVDYGKRKTWTDAVVGGRVILRLTDKVFASMIGAVGGLNANFEWDIYAGLNYEFSDRWAGFAGYRALHVDYESGNFLYKATQHGPVLGVSARF
jgi:hypothetical protein